MDIASIFALGIATFIFVVTPGPGIVALLSRTMARGIASGLLLGIGLMMGDFIYLIAVLASLHTIADTIAPYMVYVRVFGALFLAYVGYAQWVATPMTAEEARRLDKGVKQSVFHTLGAGIAISGTNPKVIVFYLSFLPQFIDLTNLTALDGVIVMVTIAAMLFAGCLVYAIGADTIFKLIKDEKSARVMNRITGGSIILVAIFMVATL